MTIPKHLLVGAFLLLQSVSIVSCQRLRLERVEFQNVNPAPVGRVLNGGTTPSDTDESLENRFTTFIQVIFDVADDIDLDLTGNASPNSDSVTVNDLENSLEDVFQGLIIVYNELVEDIDDPFERRLDSVRILSSELGENVYIEHRHLRGRKLFIIENILEAAGTCLGCSRDANLSNQIIPGSRKLKNISRSRKLQLPTNPDADLPTEREILLAWSDFIVALDDPFIQDVIFFDETDEPPMSESPSEQPSESPSEPPSKSPTPGPTPEPTSGPTSEPTQSPTSFLPPLGLCQGDCDICQGDCDYDFECAEGLYCFKRDPFQVVPGCTGGESDGSRTDYCIHNSFAPIEQPNPDAFNLQLSWEASFPWEKKEWCVQCKEDCIVGDTLFYTPCTGRSTFFEFVSPLTSSTTSVVQIEVSGTGRCLQRNNEGSMEVRNCDENSFLQHWSLTSQGGTFSDEFFEISQPAFNNDCLGPVGTAEYLDILSMEDCFALRDGFTSFWTKLFPLAL